MNCSLAEWNEEYQTYGFLDFFWFKAITFFSFFYTYSGNIVDHLLNTPGVGKVSSKKGSVFVKTELGDLKIPSFNIPSIDIDIYFFKSNIDIDVRGRLVSKKDFKRKYGEIKTEGVFKKGMNIIPPFVHTSQTGKKKVYGYITSIFSDNVYLFKAENEFIDLEKIFEEYEECLEAYSSIDSQEEEVSEEEFTGLG